MVRTSILIISLLFLNTADAYSLRQYRQALGTSGKSEAEAVGRSGRIKALLKWKPTPRPVFSAATDPNGPFQRFPEGSDRGRKSSTSGYVKTELMDAAEAMYRSERRDKPPTFDPSAFVHEIDEKVAALRNQFCESKVVKKFPALIDQYAAHATSVKAGGTTRDSAVEATERARVESLSSYLTAQSPTYEWRKKRYGVTQLLGNLERVEFVDEHVLRLTFASTNADKSVRRIPLSLSTLVTYRTDRDRYFLAVMGCLARYVDERLDGKRKGTESPVNLNIVKAELAGNYAGAKTIHRALASLSVDQLDFLVDLFLQLRGKDVPVDAEMVASGPEAKQKTVLDHIATRESALRNEGNQAGAKALMDDYGFYRLLHKQLFDLEDFLSEERALSAQANNIVRDVKQLF